MEFDGLIKLRFVCKRRYSLKRGLFNYSLSFERIITSLSLCLLASQLVFLELIGSVELSRASKALKLSKVEMSTLVVSLVSLRNEPLITKSAFQRSVSNVGPSMHD